jgi:hypothetical protein
MNAEEIAKQLNQSKPINITTTGEIISAEQTEQTPSGPVDRQSGQAVTELKPQRWYAWHDSNPLRLVKESEAMESRFPAFQLHHLPAGLTWVGSLPRQNLTRGYKISIVYPEDFPARPPKVFILQPKVIAPKHQYSDGSLCLMYPGDGSWQTNTTAVQIVAMASAWLFCYEYHELHCPTRCSNVPCKNWPGAEAAHN